MAVTKGNAIIWGVSTTNALGYTGAVSSGLTFTGEDLTKQSEKVEVKDRNGEVVTAYFFNGNRTLSLKCYPSGVSASATSLPGAGDTISLTSGDADISGDWICETAGKARAQDGIVEFDISLISYDQITP